MKTLKRIAFKGLVIGAWIARAFAQTTQTLVEQPLPAVTQVSVQYSGQPGNTQYCYWVVARYGVGNSAFSTPKCVNTNVGGSVAISWQVPTISNPPSTYTLAYDVIRTNSSVYNPNCSACLLASATTAISASDDLSVLGSGYQATDYQPSSYVQMIDNTSTTFSLVYGTIRGVKTNCNAGDGQIYFTRLGLCSGNAGFTYDYSTNTLRATANAINPTKAHVFGSDTLTLAANLSGQIYAGSSVTSYPGTIFTNIVSGTIFNQPTAWPNTLIAMYRSSILIASGNASNFTNTTQGGVDGYFSSFNHQGLGAVSKATQYYAHTPTTPNGGTITDFAHFRTGNSATGVTTSYAYYADTQTGATNKYSFYAVADPTFFPAIGTPNCTSSASPAVCSTFNAGSVVIPAGGTDIVVNTTAVTANSQIFAIFDQSLGTKLGVTCNTTTTNPHIGARVAGTSFTIHANAAIVTNPACFSFFIIN